ncbi:hypothetical protein FRC12_017939 [Ceratobasidium sp. 428]|nr:hypothetical protein FRC12_017939 [Ceratobasidium sp. 428]
MSDCFTADGDETRLKLANRNNALQSARDYTNWMSYFAGGNLEGIAEQLLGFIADENLGIEMVIRLGLAFASLAEQKDLSPEAGINVSFWISAFVQCYDEERIYLSEDMLSVLVDGLTIAGRNVQISNARDRVQALAVPHLINILWKVSDIESSKLRSSIGLNLAVTALTTHNLAYPVIDERQRNLAIDHLTFNLRPAGLENSSFISLTLFSLLGFIHPKSGQVLEVDIANIACCIIHETNYLGHNQNIVIGIPRLGLDPLRRYLTSMLIEAIVWTPDNVPAPDRSKLVETAFVNSRGWNDQKFTSILHAVCYLIRNHLESEETILHPGTLRSAIDLLFREVKDLPRLDNDIMGFEPRRTTLNDITTSQDIDPAENHLQPHENVSGLPKQVVSSTLALIMERSNDRYCLETVICTILTHIHRCDADLVMKATIWLEDHFRALNDYTGSLHENQLFHMCGYIRILASVALRCSEPEKLGTVLCASNHEIHQSIERKINLLVINSTADTDVHAFSVAGLAVWKFATPNNFYDTQDTQEILEHVWKLIAKYAEYPVQPKTHEPTPPGDPLKHEFLSEVIEALVNTTTLLAVVTSSRCTILPPQAQGLLHLLGRYESGVDGQVRQTLAVALGIWGLSLDEWDFWTPEMWRECWRDYTQSAARRRTDAAALFLLGLSRFLAHYSALKLGQASIKTIASEIDRYMHKHATHPDTLSLPFLSGFDVRRQVRESVWSYLQATDSHGPFTKSSTASRDKLRSALEYDGGEGLIYEEPQPITRRSGFRVPTRELNESLGIEPSM